MAQQIVFLRAVNLAGRNRVAMPKLREALTDGGFDDVRTYLQSGNVVLSTTQPAERVAKTCERLVGDAFGLDIDVLVRTRAQLAAVVRRDPLGDVADNPKRYVVTFLASKPAAKVVRTVAAAAIAPERVVAIGRELYAWHPDGIGRSKLAALLSGQRLGVTATGRNWDTVTKLLELAS